MGSFFNLALPGLNLAFGKSKGCCGGHHHPRPCGPMFPPRPMHRPGGCGGGGCCGGGGVRNQMNQLMQMLMQLLGRGGNMNGGMGNTGVNNGVINNYYYC